MKKFIFITLTIGLISTFGFAKSDANARNEVLNMATSSASKLCSTTAYTKCYNLNKSDCTKTIKPIIKECYSKYKSSIFKTSSSNHLSLVGNKIGQCAGNAYHNKLSNKADKECLQNESAKIGH